MIVKNETAAGLTREVPWIASPEVLAVGRVLREHTCWAATGKPRRGLRARRSTAIPPFGLAPSR